MGLPQANVPQVLPNIRPRYDKPPKSRPSTLTSGLYLDMEQVTDVCCLISNHKADAQQPKLGLEPVQNPEMKRQSLAVNLKQHPQNLLKHNLTIKERLAREPQKAYRKVSVHDALLTDRRYSQPKNLHQKANLQRSNVCFDFQEIGSEEPVDLLKQLTMRYYSQLPMNKPQPSNQSFYRNAELSKTHAKLEAYDTQASMISNVNPQYTQQWQQPPYETPFKGVSDMTRYTSTADRSTYPSAASGQYQQPRPDQQVYDSIFR